MLAERAYSGKTGPSSHRVERAGKRRRTHAPEAGRKRKSRRVSGGVGEDGGMALLEGHEVAGFVVGLEQAEVVLSVGPVEADDSAKSADGLLGVRATCTTGYRCRPCRRCRCLA